jgi:hypothetical protein
MTFSQKPAATHHPHRVEYPSTAQAAGAAKIAEIAKILKKRPHRAAPFRPSPQEIPIIRRLFIAMIVFLSFPPESPRFHRAGAPFFKRGFWSQDYISLPKLSIDGSMKKPCLSLTLPHPGSSPERRCFYDCQLTAPARILKA